MMTPPSAIPPGWVRRSDVEALKQLLLHQVAELQRAMIERAVERIEVGEDPETAIAEEVRSMLAAFDQLNLAFLTALNSKHS